MRYHLVALDFDGTLVDSARCISESLERALVDCGCAFDVSDVRGRIGLPLHDIIRHVSRNIGDAQIDPVIAAYRRHYAVLEEELIVLFSGARETVEELHRLGVHLAIATNKLSRRAEVTLDRFGIAGYFTAVIGSEKVVNPKPHPDILLRVLADTRHEPEQALMVGDTIWDLEMAARAGVAACAVAWGNQDIERLRAAQPAHVIDRFPALLQVVQTLAS